MAGSSIRNLASGREILISAGSGGVGKTTTAAAVATMAAATLGLKVLVITVDPARRLANAMGLEQFGNVESRVPDEAFQGAGVRPTGELWAAMLDTKESLSLIHISEPTRLLSISYAVFCLKKKTKTTKHTPSDPPTQSPNTTNHYISL